MSDKTEYFNAKVAGDYLGEQWVVRGSDFDAVERQKLELIEALKACVSCFNCPEWSDRCEESEQKARELLAELEATK